MKKRNEAKQRKWEAKWIKKNCSIFHNEFESILQIFILVLMFRRRLWRHSFHLFHFLRICTAAAFSAQMRMCRQNFFPFLITIVIIGLWTRAVCGMWMQRSWCAKWAFLSSPKWQTSLKRRTSNAYTIYQKNAKRERENNETDTRFMVDHNKICWNKINIIESNAKCIPNDLMHCRC